MFKLYLGIIVYKGINMTKPINGYEDLYTISNDGVVFGLKRNNELKTDSTSGYHRVILQNKSQERWLVHRLVALHFVDGYFDGAVVNHIDGNKDNNHYSNLEWCRQQENLQHALDSSLRINAIKSKQKNNKSGYIGVRKQDDVYAVQIRYKGKTMHTKYGFKTALEGARYRDKYLADNNLPHTRSL